MLAARRAAATGGAATTGHSLGHLYIHNEENIFSKNYAKESTNTNSNHSQKAYKVNSLNEKNKNFIVVCGYADLDPDWVLKKVFFALENPRTWRRECDLKKKFQKQDKK